MRVLAPKQQAVAAPGGLLQGSPPSPPPHPFAVVRLQRFPLPAYSRLPGTRLNWFPRLLRSRRTSCQTT
jgi:hypothetical protein